jgi:hypothetical protein
MARRPPRTPEEAEERQKLADRLAERKAATRQASNTAAAHRVRENPSLSLRTRVLLEDPELATFWKRGEKNTESTKNARQRGADNKRERILATLKADFLKYRLDHSNDGFTLICEGLGTRHGKSGVKYMRERLAEIGITGKNYKSIHG